MSMTCNLCGDVINLDNGQKPGFICQSHIFHLACLENFLLICNKNDSNGELKCPMEDCFVVAKAVNTKLISLPAAVAPQPAENTDQGNEDNAKECAICTTVLAGQVAMPECCDHVYCLTCIETWSKHKNNCPLDRLPYTLLFVFDKPGGKMIKRMKAPAEQKRNVEADDVVDPFFEDIICQVCRTSNSEHLLMLCDECDSGYHTFCINPPLRSVPRGVWKCAECSERVSTNENRVSTRNRVVHTNVRRQRSNSFQSLPSSYETDEEAVARDFSDIRSSTPCSSANSNCEGISRANIISSPRERIPMREKTKRVKSSRKKKKSKKKKRKSKKSSVSQKRIFPVARAPKASKKRRLFLSRSSSEGGPSPMKLQMLNNAPKVDVTGRNPFLRIHESSDESEDTQSTKVKTAPSSFSNNTNFLQSIEAKQKLLHTPSRNLHIDPSTRSLVERPAYMDHLPANTAPTSTLRETQRDKYRKIVVSSAADLKSQKGWSDDLARRVRIATYKSLLRKMFDRPSLDISKVQIERAMCKAAHKIRASDNTL